MYLIYLLQVQYVTVAGLGTPLEKPVPGNRQELILFCRSLKSHSSWQNFKNFNLVLSGTPKRAWEKNETRSQSKCDLLQFSHKSIVRPPGFKYHQIQKNHKYLMLSLEKESIKTLGRTLAWAITGNQLGAWSGSPVGKDPQLARIRVTTWQGSGSLVGKDSDHQLARDLDHQMARIRITSWQGTRITSWRGSG
jgi:hypothetical protein